MTVENLANNSHVRKEQNDVGYHPYSSRNRLLKHGIVSRGSISALGETVFKAVRRSPINASICRDAE